ncbi:arylsulfatase [Algoriphagus oliviformis]|nr:arylsulfatase [Algoriphagus oliviformis]
MGQPVLAFFIYIMRVRTKTISALIFSLVVFCMTGLSYAQSKAPNIVLIVADDLGIGDIGPYGQKMIRTPVLDRMASEGMLFSDFYAGNTVCAPSRASLMTGQHSGHTLVRGNGEFPLDPDQKILPEYLKQSGYATALFGKWGMGLLGSTGSPEKRGWDVFSGHLHHVDAHFQKPDSLDVLDRGLIQKQAIPEGMYANEYFTRLAEEFITEKKDQPFFLFLSYSVPHAELVLSPEAIQPYLDSKGESIFPNEQPWPHGRHYGPQRFPKAAYAGMVTFIDQQVGKILETLKRQGVDENTIVIFTSDNGTHVEGGRSVNDIDFFKSSGIYRGQKRDLYEGGLRVPFIVRWPAKIQAGATSGYRGVFWDLLPTFTQLAGKQAKDTDGISFAPTLLGKKSQKSHPHLYWEFHEFGGKQALLKDNWKIVRLNVSKERYGQVELYDLSSDPTESNDLAGSMPEKARELTVIMDSVRTSNPNFNFGYK